MYHDVNTGKKAFSSFILALYFFTIIKLSSLAHLEMCVQSITYMPAAETVSCHQEHTGQSAAFNKMIKNQALRINKKKNTEA
jgi:hypothetical protein